MTGIIFIHSSKFNNKGNIIRHIYRKLSKLQRAHQQ